VTGFPNSPKLLKGGLVLINADSGRLLSVISLQYNSETVSRTLQAQTAGVENGNRIEPTRFKGPAVETFQLDAEIDGTDQLEFPAQNPDTGEFGIQPQLALLESLVQPTAAQLAGVDREANSGTLEITPMLAPLALFVWSKSRIVPVKVTDFSITEEAFDPALNPIRAKVSLGLRVMSTDDLTFSSKGGSLFMTYLQNKEKLAAKVQSTNLAPLGIGGIG
jgi:hypothetical protein